MQDGCTTAAMLKLMLPSRKQERPRERIVLGSDQPFYTRPQVPVLGPYKPRWVCSAHPCKDFVRRAGEIGGLGAGTSCSWLLRHFLFLSDSPTRLLHPVSHVTFTEVTAESCWQFSNSHRASAITPPGRPHFPPLPLC